HPAGHLVCKNRIDWRPAHLWNVTGYPYVSHYNARGLRAKSGRRFPHATFWFSLFVRCRKIGAERCNYAGSRTALCFGKRWAHIKKQNEGANSFKITGSIFIKTATFMKLNELNKTIPSFENSSKMPVLFLGHGSPMNAI